MTPGPGQWRRTRLRRGGQTREEGMMKTRLFTATVLVALGFALSPAVRAAHAADASPYDKNPACMETTTDSSTAKCVIQDEGKPRHRYAPPGPAAARNSGAGAGNTAATGTSSSTSAASGGSRVAR